MTSILVKCIHISQRDASADVNVSWAGGSYTWRALRHSLICPCQPLVLDGLYLSGVTGSDGFRSHLYGKLSSLVWEQKNNKNYLGTVWIYR